MDNCTGDMFVREILRTDCIGNSRETINENFSNLDKEVCNIINTKINPQQGIELTENFTVLTEYHDRTIVVNSLSSVSITLPNDVAMGTQVSFIRAGTGTVKFVAGLDTSVRSTPNDTFLSFTFKNSVATAYFWSNSTWYVFGDLIP